MNEDTLFAIPGYFYLSRNVVLRVNLDLQLRIVTQNLLWVNNKGVLQEFSVEGWKDHIAKFVLEGF